MDISTEAKPFGEMPNLRGGFLIHRDRKPTAWLIVREDHRFELELNWTDQF
jgi:hypothetical protein